MRWIGSQFDWRTRDEESKNYCRCRAGLERPRLSSNSQRRGAGANSHQPRRHVRARRQRTRRGFRWWPEIYEVGFWLPQVERLVGWLPQRTLSSVSLTTSPTRSPGSAATVYHQERVARRPQAAAGLVFASGQSNGLLSNLTVRSFWNGAPQTRTASLTSTI